MPTGDVDLTNGDYRIYTTGVRKLVRDLEGAGVEAQDIKDVMSAAGEIVARRATWLAPKRTGRLANNMRVSKAKTRASIAVGGARVPYARYVYFGRYNEAKGGLYQTPNPFIYEALNATRGQVFAKIEDGVADILRKYDLD